VRVRLDDRVDVSFGRRAIDWELKGVPVRIEVGPRDLANGEVTLVRRDFGEKWTVPTDVVTGRALEVLEDSQLRMLTDARDRQEARTVDVRTIDEAREAAQTGFARIPWEVLGEDGEADLAAAGVTVRVLQRHDGSVPDDEGEPDLIATVARAY
jgi:prolyl-tRNA synthetase